MAFATVQSWSETPGSNTEIDGVNIDEGCNPSGINNAIREAMSQIAAWTGDDTIASATTTDLSTVNGQYVTISGTTTITGFGTVKAGWVKFVKFDGALTLTHNATSLILPGLANITTAANDTAVLVSLGSGNWRCITYQPAAGFVQLNAANTFTANQAITSSDAGATEGPGLELTRLSASPAASDILGVITFGGKDSAGNTEPYAKIVSAIVDPTNTSEDGRLTLQVLTAAALVDALKLDTAATFAVPVRVPVGSVSAPGLNVQGTAGDTDTGFYGVADGSMGITANGTLVGYYNSTGLTAATTTSAATFGSVAAVKNLSSGQIDVTRDNNTAIRASRMNGDGFAISVHSGATLAGNISVTSAPAATFNSNSDERLKENFEPFDSGEIIDALAMYRFNWKTSGAVDYGPSAQELYAVFPQAVQPGSTGDAPGDETFAPWSYDASKLVPVLIKEIQSLRSRLEAAGL